MAFLDRDEKNFEDEVSQGDFSDILFDPFKVMDLIGRLDEIEALSRFSLPESEVVNTERFEPMGETLLASFDPLGDGGDVSSLFEEEFDNLVRLSVVNAPKNDSFHGLRLRGNDFLQGHDQMRLKYRRIRVAVPR